MTLDPTPCESEAEEELHVSEERFRALVDAVTDYAIFMLDATGHVATWNAGATRTKGYEAHEIVGKHFSVFYTPEDRASGKPERVLATVRETGRFEEESWRVRKDGSRFFANVVITALRDREARIVGFAKVTRDLTEQRAAEQVERRLTRERLAHAAAEAERVRFLSLLDQVPAIVTYLRGPDFVLEYAHPRAVDAFGGPGALGKPLQVALPDADGRPLHERLRRVFDTGEPYAQPEVVTATEASGEPVETYWDSVYLPVRDALGTIEGVMIFSLDVTKSVQARQEMERASRAKDEFLATMSHELRTPLNAISGWASILRRKPRQESKLERGLEAIERNAQTQTRLVSDLLDMSRIITGKLRLRLQRTDLYPAITAAADSVKPAAEAKGVRLVVDVDPAIGAAVVDGDRLQQIVWNLLSNAVRFTPRGERVTLTADRSASGIVIRVADTGIGVASDVLPHLFERFMQVDSSTTRAHGGLGLGLAIVRHLTEAHGGGVMAQSAGLGHGMTFTVTLPIRAISPEPPRDSSAAPFHDGEVDLAPPDSLAAAASQTSLRGLRVLVVDDDVDSLNVLHELLQDAGASVTTATSARAALDTFEAGGPFDVVVSDIGMPEMDGYAFLRVLRSRQPGISVPAVALTAYARAEDAELARRAGYQVHLVKPVDQQRLIDTLKTWSTRLD